MRNVAVVFDDDDDGDDVDFFSNREFGRKGVGHNGFLKYCRRSIGFAKNTSLLSLFSSEDVDSEFSERISLIKNDFDVDDIGNNG